MKPATLAQAAVVPLQVDPSSATKNASVPVTIAATVTSLTRTSWLSCASASALPGCSLAVVRSTGSTSPLPVTLTTGEDSSSMLLKVSSTASTVTTSPSFSGVPVSSAGTMLLV